MRRVALVGALVVAGYSLAIVVAPYRSIAAAIVVALAARAALVALVSIALDRESEARR